MHYATSLLVAGALEAARTNLTLLTKDSSLVYFLVNFVRDNDKGLPGMSLPAALDETTLVYATDSTKVIDFINYMSLYMSLGVVVGISLLLLASLLPVVRSIEEHKSAVFHQFMSMPKVYDGACLAWIMLAGAATPVASPLSGHLEFGWS